jgi:hypothetical protein
MTTGQSIGIKNEKNIKTPKKKKKKKLLLSGLDPYA